jgi:peptide/nickel transport system ATP-binding protein
MSVASLLVALTRARVRNCLMNPIIRIENLTKYFPLGRQGVVYAVNGVSFEVVPSETLALVGESGSGKSTVGRCILRLTECGSGSRIFFWDNEISRLKQREMRRFRSRLQMVFQDPQESLNPRMTVEETIREPLIIQGMLNSRDQDARVRELLNLVLLEEHQLGRYRHELSGGQIQRVTIARALATNPEFIVLDEPTSSLDAAIRADVIELLMSLQRRLEMAYLFISHDLSTVKYISQRTAVMYLGEVVEIGPTSDVFERPQHPYTKALLSAVLPLKPSQKRSEYSLRGEIPSPRRLPVGCFLHSRCPEVHPQCSSYHPRLVPVPGNSNRFVRCLGAAREGEKVSGTE